MVVEVAFINTHDVCNILLKITTFLSSFIIHACAYTGYLDNQQKREKRKSGHLDMRIVAPLLAQQQQDASNNTNKRVPSTGAPPPEMRRAKSGDHLRRPRSNTSTQPGSVPAEQARQRPSRPPSQIIGCLLYTSPSPRDRG